MTDALNICAGIPKLKQARSASLLMQNRAA